jgi:hypothetical protein
VAAAFGSARGSDSPPIKTTGDLAAPIPGIQQHIPDKRSKSSSNLWQPCRTAGASPGSASDSPPRGPLRLPGAGRGVAAGALRRRQAARPRRVRARRLPALAPGDTAPAAVGRIGFGLPMSPAELAAATAKLAVQKVKRLFFGRQAPPPPPEPAAAQA